ncbi:MAG: hypothetical protein KGL39_12850 [Patescibacteria group bacterium]|nr:hypothetical protein [Patescibacteria group bacterium]
MQAPHPAVEPAWLQDAREALARESEVKRKRAARKQAAIIARAERMRSPLGRFMRSRAGKRLAAGKRVLRHLSLPVDLDVGICAEADDVGLSVSRFMAVLLALGAAQWPTYRALLYETSDGKASVPLPKLVEHILTNAVNPQTPIPPKEPKLAAWQRAAHESILQTAARKKSLQSTDATSAVLRGAGVK